MQRIVILGTSGSGKTTLARELARRLGVPHIELDAINWKPNWTPTPIEEFLRAVEPMVEQAGWTVDGNYRALRSLIWERADTLIWLDYPMRVTLMRLLRRTVWRSIHRIELWNGNRESWWLSFCSRDSVLLYAIQVWRRNRRDMPRMLAEQKALGKRVLRMRSPGQTRRWLKRVDERRVDYPSMASTASSSVMREPENST